MSEFERWFEREFANVDPTEYRGNTFQLGKSNMEYGWNAAKQSMRGEVVGYVNGCDKAPELSNGSATILYSEVLPGTPLYTHAPDSAAVIAELQAQVEELREDLKKSRKDKKKQLDWIELSIKESTESIQADISRIVAEFPSRVKRNVAHKLDAAKKSSMTSTATDAAISKVGAE